MQNNCTFGVAGIVQSRYIQSNAADMENFGVTIRRLRVAQGWSQAELAEKIGTHRNTIVRMERSKDVPVRRSGGWRGRTAAWPEDGLDVLARIYC